MVSTLDEVAAIVATAIETSGFKNFQNTSRQNDSSLYVMKDADFIDLEQVEWNSAMEEQCAFETTATGLKEMQRLSNFTICRTPSIESGSRYFFEDKVALNR